MFIEYDEFYFNNYDPTDPICACGNGDLDTGEQCDNGANNGSDGICRADCLSVPACSLQVEPASIFSGDSVSISAQYNTGNMTVSNIDFDDGTSGPPTTTSHTYTSGGNYTVSFSVTNTADSNLSVTCEDTVEVIDSSATCGDGNLDIGEECDEP